MEAWPPCSKGGGLGAFPDQLQITGAIQGSAVALGTPERFRKALQHAMAGGMLVTQGMAQLVIGRPDAGRLIDGDLFFHSEMQS